MSFDWRVSHQRTTTTGLNCLVVEQWGSGGTAGAAVYIPPHNLDRFVERVTRLAKQVKDEHRRQMGLPDKKGH